MAGIVSYGAYIPPQRVALAVLAGGAAKAGAPERACAWHDEDSLTMAVAAGMNALRGFESARVGALIFASTTHAFGEKQGAALIAKALGLRRACRTTDVGGSLRAGLDALRLACESAAAAPEEWQLVVAADVRQGAPGGALERNFGDGAAAFLVGARDCIANYDGGYAFADELVDVWRGAGDAFVHSWEERFVLQQGYLPGVAEAVRGLLKLRGARAADFAQVALAAPDARSHTQAARKIGAVADALVPPEFGRLGNAGCAFAPLLLTAALERAQPEQRLLAVAAGDGAAAQAFSATELLPKLEARRAFAWHLARRVAAPNAASYRKARAPQAAEFAGAAPSVPAAGGESTGIGLSATVHFREREDEIAFMAQRCGACGALQFPAQRVCESCFAKDNFTRERLAESAGKVITYTLDYFFPAPSPPTVVAIIESGGARLHMQLAETPPAKVQLGMPVEFVFRCIHRAGGRPNYYWKAAPRASA